MPKPSKNSSSASWAKPHVGDSCRWANMVWTVAETENNRILRIGVKPDNSLELIEPPISPLEKQANL